MRSIYLFNIQNTNIYKIGFTRKKPNLRLEALQTGNPFEIIYVNHYETERATQIESVLHRRYAHKKVVDDFTGLKGEWFNLEPDDVLKFLENCKKIDDNFEFLENSSTLYD